MKFLKSGSKKPPAMQILITVSVSELGQPKAGKLTKVEKVNADLFKYQLVKDFFVAQIFVSI